MTIQQNQNTNLAQSLEHYFNFKEFKPGQQKVIENLIQGNSAVAIFPTGSGKSLCYQLASLHLPHLTIVVSPLLALIKDQMDFLEKHNIPATRIDSTLTYTELIDIQKGLKEDRFKILMISVERFKNERFRQLLDQLKVSLMVIDEAHCISEWGHNFRPDYLKLPTYRQQFNIPQVLLLTATATPRVIADMAVKFNIPESNITITGFYRPNLHISVKPTEMDNRVSTLIKILEEKKEESTIVYVTLQKTAEEIAQLIQQAGINAIAYHAGMKTEVREEIQNKFMNGLYSCIVATIAFGMGIDKRNIRNVIHFDLPKSIENYSQEIGRAGRDNKSSDCILLANKSSLNVLENFVYGDTPEFEEIKYVLNEINDNFPEWTIKILELSNLSNIRQLPLKTLLVYLELANIIVPTYSFFEEYRLKFLIQEEELINKFKGEKKEFVQAIFQHSKKARIWTTVNFNNIINNYNTDRKRITAALDYFNEKGWITLEAKQMTEKFTVVSKLDNIDDIATRIHKKFLLKEQSEIDRIHNMLSFFESDDCLPLKLSNYFGELQEWKKCNHCSSCLEGAASMNANQSELRISSYNIKPLIEPLKRLFQKEISLNVQIRFLCGISTPQLIKAKAKSLDGFGLLGNFRYEEVKNYLANIDR